MQQSGKYPKTLTWIWAAISIGLLVTLCLFLEPKDRAIAWRTLTLGSLVSLVTLPMAALLAWTASGRGVLAGLTKGFCLVGVLTPVFAHVSAWDAAFGKLGWLTNSFGQVLTPIVSRWPAAVWIHAMALTPQIAIVFYVAIKSGGRSWEDALRLEASKTSAALLIGVWRFLPVALASALWVIISCSREIGVTDIYQIGTLAEQVYLGYSLGQLNAIGAAWTPEQIFDAQHLGLGISLVIVAWLAGSGVWLFLQAAQKYSSNEQSQTDRPTQGAVASWRRKAISILLLLVVVVAPISNLIGRVGFSVTTVDGEPVATWKLSAAVESIGSVLQNFQTEFIWSILIATASATVVAVLALPAVWFCRRSRMGLLFLAALFGVLAAWPGPSIGLTVGKLFNAFDISFVQYLYDRTIVAPVIANAIFCFPLGVTLYFFLAAQVSEDQQRQAETEGASRWQQFISFGVLGNWRSNLGCWVLTVAICFGELSATQMVLPPGMDTVPRRALGMLHAGVDEMTAALTLVTIGFVILFAIATAISMPRKSKVQL
jgi:iron(III) transport system permease protein